MKQIFEAEILDAENGMDAAFIKIPFDVKTVFGNGRPKVKAVFDHKIEYRGMLARMQTPYHMLLLRKDVRANLSKQVGDMIHVEIEPDTEPRIADVPEILLAALREEPETAQFFNKLSYTHQKEYANYINEAKKEETRLRRLEKTMEMLRNSKKGI